MLTDPQTGKRQEAFLKSPIDGQVLKRFIEAGLTWLRANQQLVNSLNVFPVPDGDTGTNMVLTMQAAFDEIRGLNDTNVGKVAHAVAHGALMGARGNSGVILSQLWRGFARALDSQAELDAPSLARAFATARDTAYKGVVRPVEGTILTVAKDMAAAAEKGLHSHPDPISLLELVVAEADASVQRTPDLLPVLKEAGVVDSGGKGLFIILEGMLRLIYGQPLDQAEVAVKPLSAISLENSVDAIEPGQDYEVVIDFQPHMPLNLTSFYGRLEEMGTSIQVGEGEGIYRLHIHVPTDNRYLPIDYTMSLGVVTRVAIENLMAQMEAIETQCQDAPYTLAPVMPGQIAVVAISPGAGLSRVFASLGAAAIVEGGQTMNPSTQEIIAAFEDLPTDQIVILPNNKNIIMTAKAAAELTVKKVAVIPTKSVPQGLAAMLRLDANGSFESVVADMEAAIDTIQTGEITTAIRSVEIDGVEVAEGQIIALHNGKLVLAATDLENAILDLLMQAQVEDYELVTLFYGTNIAKSEVIRLAEVVRAAYPRQEIEVQEGCQPHYQFIISIE